MFDIKDKIEGVVENVEKVAKNYYRLSVVQATEKGSVLGASLVVLFFVSAIALFIMFFACMGLSWWIGKQLNSPVLGFLIVAAGWSVILLLMLIFRKSIVNFIRNRIISKIYG